MEMMFTKTEHTAKTADDVLSLMLDGLAIHKKGTWAPAFTFIGVNGQLYRTHPHLGTNQLELTSSFVLPMIDDIGTFEFYRIEWLAFNNLPWNKNELIQVSKSKNPLSKELILRIIDTEFNKVLNLKRKHLQYEWVNNLYQVGSRDIWIRCTPETFKNDYVGRVVVLFEGGHLNIVARVDSNTTLPSKIKLWRPDCR